MKRLEIIACVFVGIPCVVVLLFILPIKNLIGGIFAVSCIVMAFMIAVARSFEGVSGDFFKKDKKDKGV